MKSKVLFVLSLILILGTVLRFYGNKDNPPSLNIDEVSFGYSAFSILKTAHDEHGKFMPLAFESTGDFKNPVMVYAMVPSIALFGLNEFAVRFPISLAGVLSIIVVFFIARKILGDNKFAMVAALLLATMPWHIYFSRYAYDPLLANFFLILGIFFLMKLLDGERWVGLLAAIFLGISMYSAFTTRLFVPLFLIGIFLFNLKKVRSSRKSVFVFVAILFLLLTPLLWLSVFGQANTRLGMIFLSKDIDFTRYTVFGGISSIWDLPMLFFFWVKRYLNYFQPDFLFFSGLNMTTKGSLGLGVLYLFELPWLILGIKELIVKKFSFKYLLVLWVFLGIFPASLTNNEQSEGRALVIAPALALTMALGFFEFVRLLKALPDKFFKIGCVGVYSVFIGLLLVHAFLVFSVHFPIQKSENFMDGTKESVLYAIDHQNEYQEIVFDPYRGVEAPYIVSIPHMYLLFYSQYSPAKYQEVEKKYGQEYFHFDKFSFRRVDWQKDRESRGVMFVASPWSIPERDLKEGELLKKIYMYGGDLAFLIATPK